MVKGGNSRERAAHPRDHVDRPDVCVLLDSPKPLVLVGGSSIPTQSLTAFGLSEILKALRRGKDEWNVVLKVCHRETFEKALERASFDVEAERGWFVAAAFIPQAPLLDRAACFVTHMGWNGTCEALPFSSHSKYSTTAAGLAVSPSTCNAAVTMSAEKPSGSSFAIIELTGWPAGASGVRAGGRARASS